MFAKFHRRSLILIIVASLTLTLTSLVYGAPGDTIRVSVDSDGNEGNGRSANPSISADGRYIAFQSSATNLVLEDDDAFSDIFVHDRDAGSIALVSVDSNGNVGNSNSQNPSISSDGRYVAFDSSASNLVEEDLVAGFDVYVHDRHTGETTRVSVDGDGNEGNSWSRNPSISSDGNYVAFDSSASNLISNDTNDTSDIFVHDRTTGSTTRISVASDGGEANAFSTSPSISGDGRYIAFLSAASNLVDGDNNGEMDVFVHDRLTESTTRVNVASNGSEANDRSDFASISADGRYITFMSEAGNLVEDDNDLFSDVFVHDRIAGYTTLASVHESGNEGTASTSSISADGRYVTFSGSFSDSSGNFGDFSQIHVHDRLTGNTTPVSVDSGGTLGNHNSVTPAISAGGRFVAFRSHADNLVASDTNNNADIFVHELDVEAANSYVWGVDASTDGLSLYDPATEELVRFAGSLDDNPDTYTTPTALTTVPGSGEILVWNNSDPSGVLLSVDPFSGLATRVDPNTPPQNVSLDEIAIGPGGLLYGTSGSLYKISRSTGAATIVASLGLRIGGLSFSPQGVLYGVELSTGSERLVTIDLATGAVTTIGTLSQDIGVIGDIVITADGRLFGSAFGGPRGNIFFDLDPATAAVSNVQNIQQFPPQGMGLVDPFGVGEADLQIVVEVDQDRPWYVGDTVGYNAVIRNNGPAPTAAELTVEYQYAGQSSLVNFPSDAVVDSGNFRLDLGELDAGETIEVPFALGYEAFGSYEVAATVAGDKPDPNAANNASLHTQLVNLLIDTPGLETGGLDLSGQATVDGEPLAVVGVRIPGSLIAGNPPGDIFVPSTLTPQDILSDDHFVPPAEFVAGEQFQPYPVKQLVAGNLPYPSSNQWPQGYSFIPGAEAWLTGNQYIPQPSSWDPAGRLLVADDTTMLQVAPGRKEDSTRLLISDPFAEGLTVQGIDGTRDTAVDVVDDRLCSFRYPTHIGSGDVVTYTCGSLTTTVDSGEVSVGLPDGTFLDIPEDTTVAITERSDGGFDVAVTEGGPITVTAGGFSFQLEAGQEAPDPAGDPDEDGALTALELAVGTDALHADSDGDGIKDGADPSTISLAVTGLEEDTLAPDGLRTAMLARLSDIEALIYDGEFDDAVAALSDLRRRLDGCGDQPDVNDWIIDCQAQLFVRSVLDTVTSGIGDL